MIDKIKNLLYNIIKEIKGEKKMVKFSDLRIEIPCEYKKITFNDAEINVAQYISQKDMYDIIMITLENAQESNGLYNDFLLDAYLGLNLVYLCTDIEFSEEDRKNEMELYNKLVGSKLLDAVIMAIPSRIYNQIYDYIRQIADVNMKYGAQIGRVLENVVTELPAAMTKAAEIAENFKPEQYENVLNFAKAVNGDRPIPATEPIE